MGEYLRGYEVGFAAGLAAADLSKEKQRMNTVTESIFNGSGVVVPLADVQHIEKHDKNSVPGIVVITCHTKYNFDQDGWENAIWISEPEASAFVSAWCRYRSELEAHTLMDLSPAA